MRKVVIGTRGSRLALYQTELVRTMLINNSPDLEVNVEIIKTKGDRLQTLALDSSGDKGLFTKELDQALLAGQIDLAVHSLKDIPVELPSGTCLGAILEREQPEDVLLGRCDLMSLSEGAIIGTSSRRRVAQLVRLRPDLVFRPIRGNVETRIAKMDSGEYDAIVMARAGIKRLGLEERISEVLSIDALVPAPGQAAIAVQIRETDVELASVLSSLHCERTARAVILERNVLQRLGGGCALPLGVYCEQMGTKLCVRAFLQTDRPIYTCVEGMIGEEVLLVEEIVRHLSTRL